MDIRILTRQNVKKLTTLPAKHHPAKYVWYRPFGTSSGEFIQITPNGDVLYDKEELTEREADLLLKFYIHQIEEEED